MRLPPPSPPSPLPVCQASLNHPALPTQHRPGRPALAGPAVGGRTGSLAQTREGWPLPRSFKTVDGLCQLVSSVPIGLHLGRRKSACSFGTAQDVFFMKPLCLFLLRGHVAVAVLVRVVGTASLCSSSHRLCRVLSICMLGICILSICIQASRRYHVEQK